MEGGNLENRTYIWEQTQFEWISSKLEMGKIQDYLTQGLPISPFFFLSLFLSLSSFFAIFLLFVCFFTFMRFCFLLFFISFILFNWRLHFFHAPFVHIVNSLYFCRQSFSIMFLRNINLMIFLEGNFMITEENISLWVAFCYMNYL